MFFCPNFLEYQQVIRETESLPLGSFSENEETSNGLVCLFVQFVYLLLTMLNKRKKASLKLQGLQESSKNNAFICGNVWVSSNDLYQPHPSSWIKMLDMQIPWWDISTKGGSKILHWIGNKLTWEEGLVKFWRFSL